MRGVSPALRAAVVLAAVAAACAQLGARRGARPAGMDIGMDALRAPFSAALAASLPEHTPDLVSIVAADVDDDGDVDVVANDASLHLFIWLNDGTGHLTRQQPARTNAWQGQPGDPTVNRSATTCDVPSQTSRPSPQPTRAAAGFQLAARTAVAACRPAIAVVRVAARRSPRAPPPTLRL
jgi:hypothetical protein